MWIDQVLRDIKGALRYLGKSPGFASIAVLSLALGIMATTAIYSVIHAVVIDPFPYKDVDNLMSVRVRDPAQTRRANLLFHRSISRDCGAKHDLRRCDRFHHQRCTLDRKRRSATSARQLWHTEHFSR